MDVITPEQYRSYKSRFNPETQILNTKSAALRSYERRVRLDDEDRYYLPWDKTHGAFNFREKELTLWAGETKSMKSMLTGFILMHLSLQGQTVSIASFEMPVEDTFDRACSAFTGYQEFSGKEATIFADRIFQKYWLLDHQSIIKQEDVKRFINFSAEVLHAKHIMIDSLMMITFDDANDSRLGDKKIKDFIVDLKNLAKAQDVQIHLVTHFKKPDHRTKPTRYDIFGTSSIPNIADNIFMISRNRGKEEESDEPDLFLRLDSQRNGKDDINWGLWLHDSFQFLPTPAKGRMFTDELNNAKFYL